MYDVRVYAIVNVCVLVHLRERRKRDGKRDSDRERSEREGGRETKREGRGGREGV